MIGLLGYVIDTEQADALSLKSHNRIGLLISGILDGRRTILRWPDKLLFSHLSVVLVVRKVTLDNLDIDVGILVASSIEIKGILLQVKHWSLGFRS